MTLITYPKVECAQDMKAALQNLKVEAKKIIALPKERQPEASRQFMRNLELSPRLASFFMEDPKKEIKTNSDELDSLIKSGLLPPLSEMRQNASGKATSAIDLAKKHFESHGLEKIDDLSDTSLAELKKSLLDNWGAGAKKFARDVKDAFPEIGKDRLETIYENEMHMSGLVGHQEHNRRAGMRTKTWVVNGNPCPDCEEKDGESVAIDEPFSTGEYTAHLHVNCACSEEYSP